MASGSVRVQFDTAALVNNLNKVLENKLEKGLSDENKYMATSLYRDAIAKYVPVGKSYKGHAGGALSRSAFKPDAIVKNGDGYAVRYSAKSPKGYDYADYQYNNEFENRNTPDTYGHWNRHLTVAERQEWLDFVKKLIVEGMNNG